MRVIRWTRRLATVALVLGLLVLNVLTLTSSAVAGLLSTALDAVGVETVAARQHKASRAETDRLKRHARAYTARTARRVTTSAAKTVTGGFIRSIPVVGTLVGAGFVAMEIKDACETMTDVAALERALDLGAAADPSYVCGLGQRAAADDRACDPVGRGTEALPPHCASGAVR